MRSLADDIRGRSDDELRALLTARPDLARPAPPDLTALAARAGTVASLQRAVDHLSRPLLDVLEAAVVAGGTAEASALAPLLPGYSTAEIRTALAGLHALALLWSSPEGPQVVRGVADLLGPYVAGLGPRRADLDGRQAPRPAQLKEAVAALSAAARSVLERLDAGTPVATMPTSAAGPAGQAVQELLAADLVCRVEGDRVIMPREVGLALRGGAVTPRGPQAPTPQTRLWDPQDVDGAAGAAAADLIALIDDLLTLWSTEPPRVLRSGALAVRDLRAAASALGCDEPTAVVIIEAAAAVGLVADDEEADPSWRPTAMADDWVDLDLAHRWAQLVRAWLGSLRFAARVGQPLRTGAINALSPEVQWPPVRALRVEVLAALASLPPGTALEPEGVVEVLAHQRPRRLPADPVGIVRGILGPAALLGVTARGALSSVGRALLTDEPPMPGAAGDSSPLVEAMQACLPPVVAHVHVQADLTIIAPGPVTGRLERFLRRVADVESRGGATVRRLSEASVRRALDAGESGEQVIVQLAQAAAAPLPQTVEYLVRDVARRHGRLRVGTAGSYIRSDDEGGLAALVANRELAHLHLHQVAPTVLISPHDPAIVLAALRDVGASPVHEAPGGVMLRAVPRRRATRLTSPPNHSAPVVSPVDDAVIDATIEALRVGQARNEANLAAAAARQGPSIPHTDPATSLAVLREAAADRRGVWIGHSNALGQVTRVLFYPQAVEGGRVRGLVDGVEQVLSVHRITGVAPE